MSLTKRSLTPKEMIYLRAGLQLKIDSIKRAINSAQSSDAIKAVLIVEQQECVQLQGALMNLELPL